MEGIVKETSQGKRPMLVAAIVGIALLVLGLIGWILQLNGGLLSGSGMTNIFLWGLMIALFAFFVGFGAGCQIVASAIYISGKTEMYPIAKVAAGIGLACVGAAGVAILADLGAIRNIMNMIVNLNMRSPLAWDMIALTAFIVLSIIELVMMARNASSTKIWVVLAGVAAVVLQIVEGLLFSTQNAHLWWDSPIMPIDFLAVAFVSGSALMLLVACLPCIKGIGSDARIWLARFCAIAIAVHLALALIDLGLVAGKGTPESGGVMAALMTYLPLYLCELILPAIAMALLFAVGRKDNRKLDITAAVLTVIGIFAHRMMLLFPAYDAPSLYLQLSGTDFTTGAYPISTGRYLDWDTTFALTTQYAPAGLEWLAALLPVGVAILASVVIFWAMGALSRQQADKQQMNDE